MEDRRKENKPRGSVPWDEPYERRVDRLEKIKNWRNSLSVEDVDGNWCYARSNDQLLLEQIDWLISELEQIRTRHQKVLKSLGCL
jgi:hypothetical protein